MDKNSYKSVVNINNSMDITTEKLVNGFYFINLKNKKR